MGYVVQSTNYPAFELNFYLDENLTKQWTTSPESTTFNITRNGTVGVSTDAKATLSVTSDIPKKLFYALNPIFESNLPLVKKEISIDTEVLNGNEIQVNNSDRATKTGIIQKKLVS